MAPNEIAQSIKSALERETLFDGRDVQVVIQRQQESPQFAKAIISEYVEGKIRLFEVWVRDMGVTEA